MTDQNRPQHLPALTHGLLELLPLPPAQVARRSLMTEDLRREALEVLPSFRASCHPAEPEWIGARVRGLLAHWRRPEMDRLETAFVAKDWVDALSGWPAGVIDKACRAYVQSGKFRPVPAEIIALCEEFGEVVMQTRRLEKLAQLPPALPSPRMAEERIVDRGAALAAMRELRENLKNVEHVN